MLSASIHGERERAKRKEPKEEGKENSAGNVCHKNLKEIRNKEELEVLRMIYLAWSLYSVCEDVVCTIVQTEVQQRNARLHFLKETQLILVSSIDIMAKLCV